MGVYIRDMTFPEDCAHCPYRKITYNHNDFYWIRAVCCVRGRGREEKTIYQGDNKDFMNYVLRGGRPEWCPLTEVEEPHGRLIDVDGLIEFIENRYDITWESDCYEGGIKDACTDIIEEINSMPTILEAEGAEE